ncbi:MAG: hypothetical protein PHX43_01555 [Alphaproteobacteria bacterium]|nr:hypothetical protein [Alphaproteobacteria bacterium]
MSTGNVLKVSAIITHVFRNIRAGLCVSALVLIVMISGLALRDDYIASATIEIGSFSYYSRDNLLQTGLLESLKDAERFALNVVLGNPKNIISRKCTVGGIVMKKPVLKVNCKGKTRGDAESYLERVFNPIFERQLGFFKVASDLREQNTKELQEKREFLDKSIQELQSRSGKSEIIDMKIIDLKSDLADVINTQKKNELLQAPNMTQLGQEETVITDRSPNVLTWAVIVAIALLSGFFVSLMLGVGCAVRDQERLDNGP